jgi:predicted RNA-binding Zn-ribbon protein involved in translation (DUF1610 family)
MGEPLFPVMDTRGTGCPKCGNIGIMRSNGIVFCSRCGWDINLFKDGTKIEIGSDSCPVCGMNEQIWQYDEEEYCFSCCNRFSLPSLKRTLFYGVNSLIRWYATHRRKRGRVVAGSTRNEDEEITELVALDII